MVVLSWFRTRAKGQRAPSIESNTQGKNSNNEIRNSKEIQMIEILKIPNKPKTDSAFEGFFDFWSIELLSSQAGRRRFDPGRTAPKFLHKFSWV